MDRLRGEDSLALISSITIMSNLQAGQIGYREEVAESTFRFRRGRL
jgi:hypothetical protein